MPLCETCRSEAVFTRGGEYVDTEPDDYPEISGQCDRCGRVS